MLTCDENHVYRDERGIIVPNVTSILEEERYTDFSKCPAGRLERAQGNGTNRHDAICYALRGTLDYDKLDPLLLPYVRGALKYISDYKAEVIYFEHTVHSKLWNFCGTLDIVLKIDGKYRLRDWKTGSPGCSLQTAAYRIAFEEQEGMKIYDRAAVLLKEDGTYKVAPPTHKDDTEIQLFKSIMNVHNSRKNYIKEA